MSTRAQIVCEGTADFGKNSIGLYPVYVYKHSDGHPNGETGVIATMVPFLRRFFKHRGFQPDYLLAQVIRAFAVQEADYYRNWLANVQIDADRTNAVLSQTNLDTAKLYIPGGEFYDVLGWGVDFELHSDIEYLYVIHSSGLLAVLQPTAGMLDFNEDWQTWPIIASYDFGIPDDEVDVDAESG